MKWIARSRAYETVVELVAGTRAITHEALDHVNRGQTTTFPRAALVSHGVLEARGEQTAKFDQTTRRLLPRMAAGEDRAHVRAFANWQVQHDLARRERAGRTTRKSGSSRARLMRAAVELALWTHTRGMTLADLRQEGLDRWLQEGSSATASIRPFLKWAARGGLIAPLTAPTVRAQAHTEPLESEIRLRLVRRLLHVDLRDRVGGCLVLLYAQPVSRILMLTSDRVVTNGRDVVIHLGASPLELPEPLAQLSVTLARERTGRASTAPGGAAPPWLFQGMRVGTPLDETHFHRLSSDSGSRRCAQEPAR